MAYLIVVAGGARGRLRNALIADSDDFAPIMGGGRFQLQTEDQESGMIVMEWFKVINCSHTSLDMCRVHIQHTLYINITQYLLWSEVTYTLRLVQIWICFHIIWTGSGLGFLVNVTKTFTGLGLHYSFPTCSRFTHRSTLSVYILKADSIWFFEHILCFENNMNMN